MASTVDEVTSLMSDSNATLVGAIIGVIGALLGVIITLLFERYRRKKERIENAKPIVINHFNESVAGNPLRTYILASDSLDKDNIIGSFKNTDNGILFIDFVEIGTKRFEPAYSIAIDKDSLFSLSLRGLGGASFENDIFLYCHDIYGNSYHYKMRQSNTTFKYSRLILVDSEPQKLTQEMKKNRQDKGKDK